MTSVTWSVMGWNFEQGDRIHGSVQPTNAGWLVHIYMGIRTLGPVHGKIYPTESEARQAVAEYLDTRAPA